MFVESIFYNTRALQPVATSPITLFPADTVSDSSYSHYDVIQYWGRATRAADAYGARNPRLSQLLSLWRHSHYDVIGDTPSVTDVRMYVPYRI